MEMPSPIFIITSLTLMLSLLLSSLENFNGEADALAKSSLSLLPCKNVEAHIS